MKGFIMRPKSVANYCRLIAAAIIVLCAANTVYGSSDCTTQIESGEWPAPVLDEPALTVHTVQGLDMRMQVPSKALKSLHHLGSSGVVVEYQDGSSVIVSRVTMDDFSKASVDAFEKIGWDVRDYYTKLFFTVSKGGSMSEPEAPDHLVKMARRSFCSKGRFGQAKKVHSVTAREFTVYSASRQPGGASALAFIIPKNGDGDQVFEIASKKIRHRRLMSIIRTIQLEGEL